MADKQLSGIADIKKLMPSEKEIYGLSELYKVFGDSTRTKILSCLGLGEFNVGQIAEN